MARFEAQDVVMQLVRASARGDRAGGEARSKLADELRRAVQSVALNLAEGNRRTGRDRLQAWKVAAGSAGEARTALRVAEAWGHVAASDVAPGLEIAYRACAILWVLTPPPAMTGASPLRRGSLASPLLLATQEGSVPSAAVTRDELKNKTLRLIGKLARLRTAAPEVVWLVLVQGFDPHYGVQFCRVDPTTGVGMEPDLCFSWDVVLELEAAEHR